MPLIINKKPYEVEGVLVKDFVQEPRIQLPKGDGIPRISLPTCITLHSTKGIPNGRNLTQQKLIEGRGRSTNLGNVLNDLWKNDGRASGAHLGVDHDGVVFCLQDLHLWEAFHATTVNGRSVGIEYKQGALAEFYTEQLIAGAKTVKRICEILGIQFMIPHRYSGRPIHRIERGSASFRGVFGHRDQTRNRGFGDPGDYIMASMKSFGAEAFDLDAGEDLDVWARRQTWLGFKGKEVDGIPGPKTRQALWAKGFKYGLWVNAPEEFKFLRL